MKKIILTALVVVGFMLPYEAMAVAKNCKFYEPGVTTLQGTLRHTAVWFIEMEKPFCIEGRENDKTGMYPTKDAVKTVVVTLRKNTPADAYMGFIGKEVSATGTLYHKFDNTPEQVTILPTELKPTGK